LPDDTLLLVFNLQYFANVFRFIVLFVWALCPLRLFADKEDCVGEGFVFLGDTMGSLGELPRRQVLDTEHNDRKNHRGDFPS
jgi:hypothetical protein